MYPPSTNGFNGIIEIDRRRVDYCPNGTGMSKPAKKMDSLIT
jgi:hypothetical protein